jgi:hypothetical protein
MAKKSEYVLNIGDDNVVLIRFVDKRFANAWLASPDPATAIEELGEAFAEDKKGRVSVIVDTLDQSFKEEEVPKVNILDRRKILSRHITMAFPGQSMRGARLIGPGPKNTTLIYEFASVPMDGRIPGWIEFYESLPNEKGGVYAIAPENADIVGALTPKTEAEPAESADAPKVNQWRHFIGINVTGGLRQIISKNGRLSLTRLTQAPPPDTPPDEFADMIIRDFKATITYLRRLGYQVGDPLDLVVLTTAANRDALERLEWTGARGVTFLTPYEAGAMLGLGSIGPEDQAYCDVLHAAWFANKRTPNLKLTRSVAMGDMRDDLRELAFAAAPYAAGVVAAAILGWSALTTVDYVTASSERDQLQAQVSTIRISLSEKQAAVAGLPFDAANMRNVFDVETSMDRGKFDVLPIFTSVYESLQNDATVNNIKLAPSGPVGNAAAGAKPLSESHAITLAMQLASVITTAEEAVRAARRLEGRLAANLGKDYTVKMTKEPVAAQAAEALTGNLMNSESSQQGLSSIRSEEPFRIEFTLTKGAQAK